MRIAQLHLEAGTPSRGVLAKSDVLRDSWTAAGAVVREFRPTITAGSRLSVLVAIDRAARALAPRMRSFDPDVVYARQSIWTPSVAALFASHRVVVEVNGALSRQLRRRSGLAAFYERRTAPWLWRRTAGVVGVTRELVDAHRRRGMPSCVVGSPVEVPEAMPERNPVRPRRVIMLLGEGEDRPVPPSRGLDRLRVLARALPDVDFVVLGGRAPSFAGDPANLEFRPRLEGPRLRELLATSTASVAGLAPHRSGLGESRTLKIRASLAAGLPVIHAQNDPDLPESGSFLLRLESRDSTDDGDVRRVGAFLDSVVDDPDCWREAWRHAREFFSVEVTEGRRLAFLERVAGRV